MLYLTGYHASGKSHLATHLRETEGFTHIETSAIVRQLHATEAAGISLPEWARDMETQFGNHYFDDRIIERIHSELKVDTDARRIVTTGNRSFEGIRYTQHQLVAAIGERAAKSLVIFVSTSPEIMYERFLARDRYAGDASISYEEYVTMMDDEKQRGIEEIRRHADVHVSNDGTPESTIDQLIASLARADYI